MTTKIKATNMELTEAISMYVDKKVEAINKFVSFGKEVVVYVEVGKTTKHHKQGDFYKAEFEVILDGEKFFTDSEKSDLYKAIDDAKDEIVKKINNTKKKKNTLYKRGALSIKKMLKGLSKRNPETSK